MQIWLPPREAFAEHPSTPKSKPKPSHHAFLERLTVVTLQSLEPASEEERFYWHCFIISQEPRAKSQFCIRKLRTGRRLSGLSPPYTCILLAFYLFHPQISKSGHSDPGSQPRHRCRTSNQFKEELVCLPKTELLFANM